MVNEEKSWKIKRKHTLLFLKPNKKNFMDSLTEIHTARSWVLWWRSSLALRLSSLSPSTSWSAPDDGAAFTRKRQSSADGTNTEDQLKMVCDSLKHELWEGITIKY